MDDNKPEPKKSVKIDSEEKVLLEQHRAGRKRLTDVNEELQEVLKKHNATLAVDPSSPLGNLRIVVKLL